MSGGSETGLITSREAFGVVGGALQQNIRMPFSPSGDPSAVYKPIPSSVAPDVMVSPVSGTGTEPLKRKRGRPRKYGPDGTMALAISPAPTSVAGGFSSPTAAADPSSGGGVGSPTSVKKARGRPPGSTSKKHQFDAMGNQSIHLSSIFILCLLMLGFLCCSLWSSILYCFCISCWGFSNLSLLSSSSSLK